MKYIKLFNELTLYESHLNNNPTLPNVSYVTENDTVYYNTFNIEKVYSLGEYMKYNSSNLDLTKYDGVYGTVDNPYDYLGDFASSDFSLTFSGYKQFQFYVGMKDYTNNDEMELNAHTVILKVEKKPTYDVVYKKSIGHIVSDIHDINQYQCVTLDNLDETSVYYLTIRAERFSGSMNVSPVIIFPVV